MKLKIQKNELTQGINIALRAVAARPQFPILECILIDARDGDIHFIANNTELGVSTIVTGLIDEPGAVAINAKMLSDVVRKLPDKDVTIIADNDNYAVTIRCMKSRFNLAGQSEGDFIYFPELEKEGCVTVSQYALKQALNQTLFSVLPDERNKLMTGEYCEVKDDILRLISLDGHRISIRRTPLKEKYDMTASIIPGKTLSELTKLLSSDVDAMVSIYFLKNHVIFEMGDTVMASRLIEGEYFHVDQMISYEYNTSIKVDRQMLMSMLDRATLFIRENDKQPVIFNITDDTLAVSIATPLGKMDEDMDATVTGPGLKIGFNPRFMLEALKAADEEEVTLYCTDRKSPCYIRDELKTYNYLILPVNFTEA